MPKVFESDAMQFRGHNQKTIEIVPPYELDLSIGVPIFDTILDVLEVVQQVSRVDWTPAELISPFVPRAWFAADRITGLVDGDAVPLWEDLSANGVDGTTEGDDPTYHTQVQSSLPGVQFATNELATVLSSSHRDEMLYAVIIVDTLAGNGAILNGGFGGRAFVAEASTQQLIVRKVGSPHVTLAQGTHTIELGVPILVGYRMTSDTITMSYNGTSDDPVSDSHTFTASLQSALGTSFVGSILELVSTAFDDDINPDDTAATVANIEGYLAHKWGLSRDLPADHPYLYSPPPSTIRPDDILGPSGTTLIADLDALYIHKGAINAKGDLLVGGANDLVNNLPVGGAGQLLIVDPDAVSGVGWIDPFVPDWTPAFLGTSLLGWLRPEAITTTASGDPLSVWEDASGNGNDTRVFGNDNRPTYTANLLNGYGGVDFDGTNDWMYWDGILADNLAETALAVIDVDAVAHHGAIVGSNGTGGRTYRVVTTTRQLQLTCPFAGDIDTTTATITLNTPAIVGYTLGTTTGEESIDGTVETFTHAVTPTAARTTRVGNSNDADHFDGVIYEIVVCSTLSSADRKRVEGYLAHKYGLTANLPSTHPYKTYAPSHAPWVLEASATWNIGDTTTATAEATTITVTGAALGDAAIATVDSLGATNWLISAHVQSADTVRVLVYNVSGGNLNPASGTLTVKVIKSP